MTGYFWTCRSTQVPTSENVLLLFRIYVGISHGSNDSVVMSGFVCRWSGRGCLGSSWRGTGHRGPSPGREQSAPEWQTPGASGHVWHQC